jgi:CRISPR-associated protein Csm2
MAEIQTYFAGVDGKSAIGLWISDGIKKEAIDYAEKFGEWLHKNGLTTTQIRNIYGEVKRIQMAGKSYFSESDVLLLRPKLAYAKARASGKKDAIAALAEVLSAGINAIFVKGKEAEQYERFDNFAAFFEAVIAYHRANGGK